MDKKKKLYVGIVIVIIFALLAILGVKIFRKNQKIEVPSSEEPEIAELPVEEKKEEIKIFQGNERPIAFMIDNNVNAKPQSSLNKAYLIYEIIVEGGETRLMALFIGVFQDSQGYIVRPCLIFSKKETMS